MQALYSTLGHTFPADNAFSLLYVMYNPVCRKDIIRKNRLFNELLVAALHPLHKEYLGHTKSFVFYMKSGWIMLKFAIKNRAIADCPPTLVLAASEQPHAALLKDINRMLMLVNSAERDAKTNWNTAKTKVLSTMKSAKMFLGNSIGVSSSVASPPDGHLDDTSFSPPLDHASSSCFEKMKNCWKRHNRIVPTNPDNEMRYDDAPKSFVDSFALKREFVVSNITEEARVSLLTMLIFTEDDDFGSSLDCRLYKRGFDAKLISFQKAFRVLFLLLKQLEFADSSENIKRFSRKERIFQRVSDMIFGKELKLLRNFHLLSDKETAHLFLRHDFPELDVDDFFVPSVDAVLEQLLADDKEQSACALSKKGIHPHALDNESFPNTLNLASSILASNQMQPSLSAHDHDVQSQSIADTASHAPQAFALTRPSAMFSKKSIIAVSREAPIASAVHESINDADACPGSKKLPELKETRLKRCVTKDDELCAIKDELKSAKTNNAALLAQVKELQTALQAASQKNKFPHSQINEAASAGAGASSSEVQLASVLAADTEHHSGSVDSASTVITRCRPKIYSSKNLRVTARACINEVTSPAFGSNAEQLGIDTFYSYASKEEKNQSGALIHVPTAAEANMLALMSENSALRNELKDAKINSDAEIKTLQTALHAALEAQRSLQTQSEKGLKSAAIKSFEDEYKASLQRAAAAEAQVHILSSKVKIMQDALDAADRLRPEQSSAIDAFGVGMKSANASPAAVVQQKTAASHPQVSAINAGPLASREARKSLHAPSQQAVLRSGSTEIETGEDKSAAVSTNSAGLHSKDSAFQDTGRFRRTAASFAKLTGQMKELRNEGRTANQAKMFSPDQVFQIESSEMKCLDGLVPFKKVCLNIIHKNMLASTNVASSVTLFCLFAVVSSLDFDSFFSMQ